MGLFYSHEAITLHRVLRPRAPEESSHHGDITKGLVVHMTKSCFRILPRK